MGVLDELKRQGDREPALAPPATQASAAALGRADDALARLHGYFTELRDRLRGAGTDIRVAYTVHGDTRLTNLAQGDYKLGTHEPDKPERFSFHFACTSAPRRELRVAGRDLAMAQRERLRGFDLRFLTRDLAQGGMVFVIESFVPVALDFRRDDERGAVRLVMRNLASLGSLTYTLTPERIDAEFLDELARAVMRQPNRVAELTGHDISDATRMKLRVQLAEEHQQREREGETNQRLARATPLALFRRGLFGRR